LTSHLVICPIKTSIKSTPVEVLL